MSELLGGKESTRGRLCALEIFLQIVAPFNVFWRSFWSVSHLTSFGSLSNGRRCFPGGQCRLARYSHPPPCCYPRSRGNCAPPPPPPVEPPFLVQARSTPVAPHTFTKTNVQPYLIEVVFSKHPKHSQCCSFSWVFASIFPPSNFFVLGKWLRRKWFNRHRMPPMCRASNPQIYSSQFRIFT